MHVSRESHLRRARRKFLSQSLWGAGTFALASLLDADGVSFVGQRASAEPSKQGGNRIPGHNQRARNCIYIYLEGGLSQMDLFDPKPKLNELDGQPLPESFLKDVQFAFLQKDSARLMGTSRRFTRHGECGMDFSDLLPHLAGCADDLCMIRSMHGDQFNHVPGQLLMNCGSPLAGRPSVGAWLNYGLGSESKNLPSFVSLVTTGRGIPGGSASWSSGFLPSHYSGVLFGTGNESVPNLPNPVGITDEMQRASVTAVNDLNRIHLKKTGDTELESRIRAYEMAFRMQSSAPELTNLSDETASTLQAYGFGRKEPSIKSNRGGTGLFEDFSHNCLMARRLVERGVRVVNIIHSSWDHHSNLEPELKHNSLMVDQPIAALILDLKQRGMLDDTLVVITSEFGRTALGENRMGYRKVTGRDHHPFAFTTLLAGGGVRGGQIIGASDEIGWHTTESPVHIHDLHATLLHLFGLDHTQLTYHFQGRDFRLTDVHGTVVPSIFTG